MPTVNTTIAIAKLSQAYALIAIEDGGLNGGGIDLLLPEKIYNIRKSVEFVNNIDPTNSTLQGTSNYLYALCAPFNKKAEYTLAQAGSGTVSPVSPITSPNPIEFVVSDSSLMVAGGSSLTIASFIGFNLLFVRNNITQSQINNGGTYFSWNRLTGIFSCFGAASDSELFQFYPFL